MKHTKWNNKFVSRNQVKNMNQNLPTWMKTWKGKDRSNCECKWNRKN